MLFSSPNVQKFTLSSPPSGALFADGLRALKSRPTSELTRSDQCRNAESTTSDPLPFNPSPQPVVTHVCVVLSDFLDVLYAHCFCLKQELVFSLLYDDIDLLLAVIVLNQSGVKSGET